MPNVASGITTPCYAPDIWEVMKQNSSAGFIVVISIIRLGNLIYFRYFTEEMCGKGLCRVLSGLPEKSN